MNCSESFGTQHAITVGVHVSSKVVSSIPAENVKVASTSASANGFKDAFSAASEAASAHKAQSSAKQSEEKKSTREKQSAQNPTTPAVTVPETKTSLPLAAGVVVPPAPQVTSGANDSSTQDSITPDARGKGVVSLPSVASVGGKIASVDDETASIGDANAGSGDKDDTSTGTDLPKDAGSVSNATPVVDPTAPSDAVEEGDAVAAKQSIKAATISALASGSSADNGDGSITSSKSAATAEEDKAKSCDSVQPDAATQGAALANTLPVIMPPSIAAANQSVPKVEAAQTGSTFDNSLGSSAALKSGGSKQTVASGKDRAVTSDVRSKGKSEDAGAQAPSTEMDASFAAKISAVVANIDHQAGSSHSGSAGGDPAQQAMQAATANAASANPSASQATASPPTAGAGQSAPAAPSASAAQAQELPTLNSAHLLQSMGQSEMKLGMHSAEFGSISINTSLTHQALSAEISISHSALGQALVAHLPSIEQKLGSAYGLQARVEVRDSSTSSSGDSGRQSQNGRQPQTSGSSAGSSIAGIGMAVATATTTTSLLAGASRLDIRI